MTDFNFQNQPEINYFPSTGLVEEMLSKLADVFPSSICLALLLVLTEVCQQIKEIKIIYLYIFYANECNDLY